MRYKSERFYTEEALYFVSTNTKDWYRYFDDVGAATVLLETIRIAREIYGFKLYSFIIMPDHLHMLVFPGEKKNISQIMQFIKRHSSQNINKLVAHSSILVGKISKSFVQEKESIRRYCNKLENIRINKPIRLYWQPSFHDHILRTHHEFDRIVEYINDKNLWDLVEKYKTITADNMESYPFYTYTHWDMIDEW